MNRLIIVSVAFLLAGGAWLRFPAGADEPSKKEQLYDGKTLADWIDA
jgi:hypothetical protein